MLKDNPVDYYEAAWSLRRAMIESIMEDDKSLSRVMARFVEFESKHDVVEVDDKLYYRPKPKSDPISHLETPIKAISCGAGVPNLPFMKTSIGDLISSVSQGCDKVVELGSGYGRRLFETWLAGGPADAHYIGIEPTSSGRDLAEKMARLEPAMTFSSQAGDHSSFDPTIIGGKEQTLFVTCFSLILAPEIGIDLFRRIAAIPGQVLCLFIEPIGFQISPQNPLAARQLEATRSKNWNQDLFKAFNQAAGDGLIEPLFVGRDLFGNQDDPITQGSVLLAAKV